MAGAGTFESIHEVVCMACMSLGFTIVRGLAQAHEGNGGWVLESNLHATWDCHYRGFMWLE